MYVRKCNDMAHVTSKSCKIFEQNNERYEKKWHNKRSQVLVCCCCCKVAVTRDWLKQSGRNIDDNEERKCLLLIYLASCQVLLCFLVIDGTFIGALSGTFVTLSLDGTIWPNTWKMTQSSYILMDKTRHFYCNLWYFTH